MDGKFPRIIPNIKTPKSSLFECLSTHLSRNVDQFEEWPLNKEAKRLNREKEAKINLKKKENFSMIQKKEKKRRNKN
jgi:hypothetical protein